MTLDPKLAPSEKEKVIVTYSELEPAKAHAWGLPMAHKIKHGMSGTPTYLTWRHMIRRCTNPSDPGFKNYGGRGITVCKRWRKFGNFLKDMGVRPEGKTIERINNNAGYTKTNCRWATRAEQAMNQRSNRLLTHQNKTQPASAWAREVKINYHTLLGRKMYGWSDERTLSTTGDGRERLLTIQGVTMSVTKWAEIKGIAGSVLSGRLYLGWSPEDAVNTAIGRRRIILRVLTVSVVDEHIVGVAEQVGVMV